MYDGPANCAIEPGPLVYPKIPVPAKVVTMPAASAVFLSLEQPDGRTVLSRSENAVAGENRYALDAAGLPSGMYWLRVKNGAGETVEVRQVYLY